MTEWTKAQCPSCHEPLAISADAGSPAKLQAIMLELAKVKPSPVSKFCFPCPRCNYERQSSQPSVAMGLYTADGLVEHLATVHGEGK